MVELRKIENPFYVKVTRDFSESAQEVFNAWIDPVGIGNWLFSTPDGKNKVCEVDAREGGDFRIGEQRGDEMAMHVGTFHKISRPNQIIFSYYMEPVSDDLPSNVTVDITEKGEGCTVTVTHEMDDIWAEYEDSAVNGWNMIFDGLEKHIMG